MHRGNFEIRTMGRDELAFALRWAEREGWNPGLNDAECFYAADPGGFFIGRLDGEPVACVSAVRYGDDFGFMGFYIVKPEYRGRGYGMEIAGVGMQYLEGRNIGLDGVVEQQDNYRKSGFQWAFRNVRYRGRGSAGEVGGEGGCEGVVPLADVPFDTLATYDRQLFPAERREFLKAWISQKNARALGVLRGGEQGDGELSGYGVIRQCCEGHKIGPLFADSREIAERLFGALTAKIPSSDNVYLDIPEPNSAALELVKRRQMDMVFETARMYSGVAPEIPLHRLFGITTFELG